MESYFWAGDQLDNFLFKGLNTKTWGGFLGVCAVLTSLSLVYEGLHLLKGFFLKRFLKARKSLRRHSDDSPTNAPSSSNFTRRRRNQNQDLGIGSGEPAPRSLLEETDDHNKTTTRIPECSGSTGGFIDLGISAVLHSIYMFLGFTLMNAVMTFNVWILVAICIGIAGGYFCFGNHRSGDNLMNPFNGTETTSLNDSDLASSPPPNPITSAIDLGGGGDNALNPRHQGPISAAAMQEDDSATAGELSRLIVGAQVHAPRFISSSTNSN